MSRSGYNEDMDDNWALIRWRGQVASATKGKRGQKLLTDLLVALDAMPDKALVAHELEVFNSEAGRMDVCALGALGHARGIDMAQIDPDEPDDVASAFGVAAPLVREIVYMNDSDMNYFDPLTRQYTRMTPELRWKQMRSWVASQIKTGTVVAQ